MNREYSEWEQGISGQEQGIPSAEDIRYPELGCSAQALPDSLIESPDIRAQTVGRGRCFVEHDPSQFRPIQLAAENRNRSDEAYNGNVPACRGAGEALNRGPTLAKKEIEK